MATDQKGGIIRSCGDKGSFFTVNGYSYSHANRAGKEIATHTDFNTLEDAIACAKTLESHGIEADMQWCGMSGNFHDINFWRV